MRTLSKQDLIVYRAVDKLDRLGPFGVFELLTIGRRDESGDWTPGAGLSLWQAMFWMMTLGWRVNVSCYRDDIGHVSIPSITRWEE